MGTIDAVIATLNNLGVGPIDKIEADLEGVREELERRDLRELVQGIDECRLALSRGDLSEFRRVKERIVSRLGHLRFRMD